MMANQTHTLDDLTSGKLANLSPPARLAVLGDPVAHSRSPGFQNAAFIYRPICRFSGIDILV